MKLRILHIEDDVNDARIIQELLLQDGIEGDTTRVDGREECAAAFQQGGFDLILCDYNLPSFDGLSALVLAKEKLPNTPFIFVSGALGEEKAIESLKMGATDYVLKDRMSRLPAAVRRAIQDVTEHTDRKRLEEQLLHAQKMETIGTLAGGIAHDFNNILGIVLGYVSLMQRGEMEPEKFSAAIDAVIAAAERGATLVRQLLTFARKSEVRFQTVGVDGTVNEVVKMCSETFAKQISFVVHHERNTPAIVADENQLHQALLNICVNARDAMPRGGILSLSTEVAEVLELRKRFPEARGEKYVCISVTDTGTGMDETTRSRIFEPFFTTKGIGKGTGLGLAMVYGIINSHRGLIDVESAPGKGTTFRLYFPVPTAEGTKIGLENNRQDEIVGGSETILFVEDEDTLVELVSTVLRVKGYKVLIARNGIEAVQMFKEKAHEIALVLTDLGLPKLGGWEAFQKMREIRPEIVAIISTGYIDPKSRSDMLKHGVKGFIQKPFVVNTLLKTIKETLDMLKPLIAASPPRLNENT